MSRNFSNIPLEKIEGLIKIKEEQKRQLMVNLRKLNTSIARLKVMAGSKRAIMAESGAYKSGVSGGSKKRKTKRKTTKKTRKPKVHKGPRGGKYIIRKGKKVYV